MCNSIFSCCRDCCCPSKKIDDFKTAAEKLEMTALNSQLAISLPAVAESLKNAGINPENASTPADGKSLPNTPEQPTRRLLYTVHDKKYDTRTKTEHNKVIEKAFNEQKIEIDTPQKLLKVLFALAAVEALNENEAFCAQYLLYRIFKDFAQYENITEFKNFHPKTEIKHHAKNILDALRNFRFGFTSKDDIPSEPWISIIKANKFDQDENSSVPSAAMNR